MVCLYPGANMLTTGPCFLYVVVFSGPQYEVRTEKRSNTESLLGEVTRGGQADAWT